MAMDAAYPAPVTGSIFLPQAERRLAAMGAGKLHKLVGVRLWHSRLGINMAGIVAWIGVVEKDYA